MKAGQRKRWFRPWAALLAAIALAIPAQGAECAHNYETITQEPGCLDPGMRYEQCTLCGDTQNFESIGAMGHDMDEWYVLQEPTCTQEGIMARDCVRCGFREEASIAHQGHEYIVEVVAPTCTARGYTSHYCPGCGDRFRTDYTDPLGHRYDDGVVTKEPTLTAMGRILYTCIGCGDTYQEMIPKLTNPFEDIDENAYYFDAVIWAVNNGITTGMDETHFAPDAPCSRAQVVTFLWRSEGCPMPEGTANPFADVPDDAFYTDAVLWAYEQEITTGTDSRHFSPLDPCNRAQVVTFLHRLRGEPASAGAVSFPDVTPGDYYYIAVLWAAERGITVGMDGGRFCPALTCTRGQIVTFLYRDRKNNS